MGKGIPPNNEPLSDEALARVLAGHPHESVVKKRLAEDETIDQNFVERTMRSANMANGKDPYVTELLIRMAKLYAERNAVYKDNYLKVGAVMAAMFPHGKTLKTAEDFNRWHIFELSIVKLTRYANSYEDGGHEDSIEDMIVYLAMLAAIDHAAEISGDES